MNSVLDYSLVGLVLLVSAAYAAMSLGPRSLRPRLLAGLGTLLAASPRFLGLRGIAQRLASASVAKAKGACGGCDNCGSEPSSEQKSPAPEVRVPLTKIGRRI